jgi:hypothetical protein
VSGLCAARALSLSVCWMVQWSSSRKPYCHHPVSVTTLLPLQKAMSTGAVLFLAWQSIGVVYGDLGTSCKFHASTQEKRLVKLRSRVSRNRSVALPGKRCTSRAAGEWSTSVACGSGDQEKIVTDMSEQCAVEQPASPLKLPSVAFQ